MDGISLKLMGGIVATLALGCSSGSEPPPASASTNQPAALPSPPVANASPPTPSAATVAPEPEPPNSAPEVTTSKPGAPSTADQRAKDAYQLFLDGKDYAGALAGAANSPWTPVVQSLIDAGKLESGLLPGTASAERDWKAQVDPLYEKALQSAFLAAPDAVRMVKAAAAKSARAYATEARAKEWEAMPEPGSG